MELGKNAVVISRMGHDAGRVYVVTARVNEDFVLVVDGKYRKLDNPKLKRVKHVKPVGESDVLDRWRRKSAGRYVCTARAQIADCRRF